MKPGNSLPGNTRKSIRRSDATEMVGAHAPLPGLYTKGSSPTTGLSHTSLGRAKTSPPQRPYFTVSHRPRHPRIAGPAEKSAHCSNVRRHSRQRACCLGDASSTPASARPRCVPPKMRQFTKRHQATGETLQSRCMNASATTTTRAAPSTPAGAPMVTQGKEPAVAIILDAASATTVARTRARASAYRGLRPSADTSSTLLSHQGTDRLPISLNILGRQTPGFGSKTIGLPVKPVA